MPLSKWRILPSESLDYPNNDWYIVCAVCAPMTTLLTDRQPKLHDFSLDFDSDLISRTLEYRGCGIRAASYEVQAQSWLPEACVWLCTDEGHRKIWVHSFSHCFAAEELTFPSKFDADRWALDAAKSIIDRAFEAPQLPTVGRVSNRQYRLFAAFRAARSSVLKRKRSNHFPSRH